ncbi:MAG: family 10 glycosylhydrolase [Bacilli bacterium]|nr:family 10 glycosylhydrolase [Bacilli bacterium]
MKLKGINNEYLKYRHNNEEIDIPEYCYQEDNVRGVWIANVANMDTGKCENVEEYKKELISILDTMKLYNMNTAIFHVRPTNDAYYPSKLNPWSKYLTGVEGRDPGFDVLAFFIEEAAKRSIKVHAWFNPYRVSGQDIEKLGLSKDEFLETLSVNNWARLHKEHTIVDGANKIILRPGHREVIDFVTESMMEVARNYDVEALHIDDFFYPYAPIPKESEEEDYLKYCKDNETFEDWRRRNVDMFIENVHKELEKLYLEKGKRVEFGVSPFPIYRTNKSILETGWEKGSYHTKEAFQCYEGQYSDIYKWMKEGWIDYIVPQDYFSFNREDVSYHDICWWWANICKETKTKLYMGQAIYHVGEQDVKHCETWQDPYEIHHQLAYNTKYDNIQGTIFFHYKNLIPGKNKILDEALEILKQDWKKK